MEKSIHSNVSIITNNMFALNHVINHVKSKSCST